MDGGGGGGGGGEGKARQMQKGNEGIKQDWGGETCGGRMETKKTRVTEIDREKWAV